MSSVPPAKKLRGSGRARVGVELSPEEFEYVDTSAKGNRWWRCKKCTDEKESAAAGGVDIEIQDEFAKRSAKGHLTQRHSLSHADYSNWVIIGDQIKLKHGRGHLMELESACGVTIQDNVGDVTESTAGDEGGACDDAVVAAVAALAGGAAFANGFKWIPHQVLVKCSNDGTPVYPLEYGGIVGQLSGAAAPHAIAHGAASSNCAASSSQVAISEHQAAPLIGLATQIGNMHAMMVKHEESENWAQHMPDVCIKPDMLTIECPSKKGEEGVLRSWYPHRSQDLPSVSEFYDHLIHTLAKKKHRRDDLYTGAMRFLSHLEVKTKHGYEAYTLDSPEAMVGLFKCSQVTKLCMAPLLAPKHRWTLLMIHGAVTYVQWHMQRVAHTMLEQPQHHCSKYNQVLQQLIHELKAGHLQRCIAAYNDSISAKIEEDRQALEKMPPVAVLQKAVQQSYMVLQWVAHKYKGADRLPRKVKGLVNACMAGAIAFDTFAGRKGEWESLQLCIVVEDVLQKQRYYVLCTEHKTSKTYGELCKRLTPGLFKAFELYSNFPRPCDCNTFLVPVNESTAKVSLPHALRSFCKMFLPDDALHPWYNLVRKWFHTMLMRMTADEKKLKELMKKLDAHSVSIQEKHYIIRSPEDDMKLADALIATIMKAPVKWPTWEQTTAYIESAGDPIKCAGVQDVDESCDDIEAEDDLHWWEFGKMFGVKVPETLAMAISYDQPSSHDVLPLHDVQAAKLEQAVCDQQQAASSTGLNQLAAKENTNELGGERNGSWASKAQKDWLVKQIFIVNANKMMDKGKAPDAVFVYKFIADGVEEVQLPTPDSLGISYNTYVKRVLYILKNHRPDNLGALL